MSSKSHSLNLVKQVKAIRVGASETDDAIYNFLLSLDCPRSLSIWLLYSNKEYVQLIEMTGGNTDPYQFNSVKDFRDAYTATQFLSKAEFLTGFDKKEAAMKKFWQFEEQCRSTNSRIRDSYRASNNHDAYAWLRNATKQKIDKILGEFDGEEWVNLSNWGPGTSTLVKGEHVSATNKFQCDTGITRDLYSLVAPWFGAAYPRWHEHIMNNGGFTIQRGNRVVTVPKNSKTDRVIAIEPGINLWFQKGIGAMIKRRVRRFGLDLESQERNQQLCLTASLTDGLATVDFSSASDSISRAVVEELIPPRWFMLMDASRSKTGSIDSSDPFVWHKFSSMGNGFTFELESLIFYAAACAVCGYLNVPIEDVSVFGDDVIIPTQCFSLFSEFSAALGFTVNQKKSFSSGPFRESCGAHYFRGSDAKPLYLKKKLTNVQTIYKLANGVRLLSHRRNFNYGCDIRFRRLWQSLYHRIPKPLRLGVSRELGDAGFIVNYDEACPVRARDWIEGSFAKCLVASAITGSSEEEGLFLDRLRGSPDREHRNTYALRGRTRIGVKSVLVPQWYNLGEWW